MYWNAFHISYTYFRYMHNSIVLFDCTYDGCLCVFIAMCPEQSSGGAKHAAAEPSAGLCPAAGPGGHEDRWPWNRLGERSPTQNQIMLILCAGLLKINKEKHDGKYQKHSVETRGGSILYSGLVLVWYGSKFQHRTSKKSIYSPSDAIPWQLNFVRHYQLSNGSL